MSTNVPLYGGSTPPAGPRRTETDAVIEAATSAAEANDLDPYVSGHLVDGMLIVDLPHTRAVHVQDLEQYLEVPRAKTGHVAVTSPHALVVYVKAHAVEGTSLWANRDAGRVVAVIDDHIPGDTSDPGWGRHRATLTLRHTPEWDHWTRLDGQFKDQATFAEHLEDGVTAIVEPDAASVLEAARTLHVQREAEFHSADRPHSGEIRFTFHEHDTAKAGKSLQLELPENVVLQLAPWEGSTPVLLGARLRYRLAAGHLMLGYRLVRPHEALTAAWETLLGEVSDETSLYVYASAPRS
jgi:uncharacterized protein YfdQ (DUF2303 family)